MRIDANSLQGKGPLIVSVIALSLLIFTIGSLFFYPTAEEEAVEELPIEENRMPEENIEYYYGISSDSVRAESKTIVYGQSLSTILGRYGLDGTQVHDLVVKSKGIFDVRSIKTGGTYTALLVDDKIRHFIYEIDPIEYVKYTFYPDSISVERIKRDVESNRKTLYLTVTSSLWESIISAGGSAAMVVAIDDIFQWTVDFYDVKKGDGFSIIYDENFVEGKSIGLGNIIAISYRAKGKSKYAFRYEKDGKSGYWNEEGMSLRRAFLKAPLRYSRISSKFTYRRLHPISKIYKAHTGVDYAAPAGTPVQSIADGVVIDKFYNAGGGNTLKIKHNLQNGAYVTGYLHLRGYANGIRKGSRVSQGQVIAYVGSTGGSTGPHLDFRI
ncbi:MAG: peptidoglycan DD-metalloendopeptidase family protein, partial [Rikenellaceae bacterium]